MQQAITSLDTSKSVGIFICFANLYMYIVFEGVVGTGKTTQSKRLAVYLQEMYPDKTVLRVREPGTGEIADAIRKLVQGTEFGEHMDPLCETYLYAASRAQVLMTKVIPVLDA